MNKSVSKQASGWIEFSSEMLSEEFLRKQFPASAGYRISPGTYRANERFSAYVGREIAVYVIEGNCTYNSEELSCHVTSGQFLELSPGWYTFEAGGAPVQLVKVFKIPDVLRRKERLNDGEA